jgi:hypothetical protein
MLHEVLYFYDRLSVGVIRGGMFNVGLDGSFDNTGDWKLIRGKAKGTVRKLMTTNYENSRYIFNGCCLYLKST